MEERINWLVRSGACTAAISLFSQAGNMSYAAGEGEGLYIPP